MKKLFLLGCILFGTLCFLAPEAKASFTPAITKAGVRPASQKAQKRILRKTLRKARKQYRHEMKGMKKTERKVFLLDKIKKPTVDFMLMDTLSTIGILAIPLAFIIALIGRYILPLYLCGLVILAIVVLCIGFLLLIISGLMFLGDALESVMTFGGGPR